MIVSAISSAVVDSALLTTSKVMGSIVSIIRGHPDIDVAMPIQRRCAAGRHHGRCVIFLDDQRAWVGRIAQRRALQDRRYVPTGGLTEIRVSGGSGRRAGRRTQTRRKQA